MFLIVPPAKSQIENILESSIDEGDFVSNKSSQEVISKELPQNGIAAITVYNHFFILVFFQNVKFKPITY